jgi:two-component system cell cycle response regulator
MTSGFKAPGHEIPGSASRRVLVAEDGPMFRKILSNWLEQWGYQVTLAEDGESAWRILQEEQTGAPQILIFDWMMPGIDGLELCARVRRRERSPYQYILLVTARDDKHDLIRGLDAGADDYLPKPFDRNELRARLRTAGRILSLQEEQSKAREHLQFLATHDELTSIWNRRAILDLFHRQWELALRSEKTIGLMMIDIDHFKRINDSYGHLCGDAVLQEVASRMQKTLRAADLAGRYGGEEFIAFFPDSDEEQVQSCAERFRDSIAATPVLAEGLSLEITISAGTVVADPRFHGVRQALAAADAALYDAKRAGRNRVVTGFLKAG